MKIALDAMGGDYAPKAIIEGALLAKDALSDDVELILIGQEPAIKEELKALGEEADAFTIVHADEVIKMAEHPTKAISQKQNSSIVVGFHLLKEKKVDCFCSAGNTGAMLVGAMFSIRSVEGVIRPGIAGFIPKLSGKFGIIVDVGANADCKADVLNQFAEMGSMYAEHVMDVKSPKIGLMNLGEEEEKGTLLTQAAHQLLKINKKINFVGNIEGRDVFNDAADVIVCDGLTGNVILKMAESLYPIFKERDFLDDFTSMFNYEEVGGSPILGVNGNVIIGHGVSSPLAIKNMLSLASKHVSADISNIIKKVYN